MWSSIRCWSLVALFVGVAGTSWAVDGVTEINQNCAIHTGCGSADTPGFPVTFSNGGGFVLTGDLFVPAGVDGITMDTFNGRLFDLDLNGFTIDSTASCDTAIPPVCAGPGTGTAVRVIGSGAVRNGEIRQFHLGIDFGNESRVENVVVREVVTTGIDVGNRSHVIRSRVTRIGGMGIAVGGQGLVFQSKVRATGGTGIYSSSDSRVQECTATEANGKGIHLDLDGEVVNNTVINAGEDGIKVDGRGIVTGNRVENSEDSGIVSGDRSLVTGNASYSNGVAGIDAGSGSVIGGNSSSSNDDAGIQAGGRSLVHNNVIDLNQGSAIFFTSTQGAYRENVLTANGSDVKGSASLNLGANSCGGALCP